MRVLDVADGCIAFAPAENTNEPYRYLTVKRLCDATTVLSDNTWAPLLENPRYEGDDLVLDRFPDGDWRTPLREHAENINDPTRPETGVAALKAMFLATPLNDIPAFLTREMPVLFDAYPDGSLWFVQADPLLSSRFTLLRMLVASKLAPDVFDENEAGRPTHVLTLVNQSLSRGTDIGRLIDPLLLLFSPATLGFTLQWMPHALVFLTGHTSSMLRGYPATPWALYDPGMQTPYVSAARYADFIVDVPTDSIESLLQWWVQRLNIVYSHLLDPTGFADDFARYLPQLQLAWFLTFERMLADVVLVQTAFSHPELTRQQAAFDLLDKAETMLGFGTEGSGKGFERMLRRSSMLDRLAEIWLNLPIQIQPRVRGHAQKLYDSLYSGVQEHCYPHRLTASSVKVWSERTGRLEGVDLESYVSQLVRAIRNSAHGFIHVLTSDGNQARHDRAILAGHDGLLPPEFPDIAALLGFALVADFERVAEGTWLPDL